MDVIILAGGKGSRMEDALPKALASVRNNTIIDYQINYFLQNKFVDNIILALGYKSQEVVKYVENKYHSKKISFSLEEEPLGTGGAIRKAMSLSQSEKIIILNCDDLTDIPISELVEISKNTICVANPRLPFGLVEEDEKGFAIFKEKPILDNWVSCGWYVLDKKEIFSLLPQKGSIEYEVFPQINLRVYKHKGFWYTFNSKKDISEFVNVKLPKSLQIID